MPLSTFVTDDFSGAGQCVMCHEVLKDAEGQSVSITADWRSTMMANSAKDPVWRTKVASEVARNPHLKEVIEKKCGGCHTPMAGEQADVTNGGHELLGNGFFNANHPLHEAAIDGVSCSLCHQIQAGNLGKPESFSGGYEVDTSTNPPDRVMYGPYENPFAMPMQMHSGYLPAYGEHTASAEFCATCHNLITPFVNAKGEVAGEFPEQTPYTEWQHSLFGKSNLACQGCHMPKAKGGVVISPMPANLAPREPFYQHYFVGGNVYMVNLLKDNIGELGVTADATHLQATAERTQQQLKTAASMAAKKAKLDGRILVVELQVSPATGHKFPTSFPSRRAWVHLTVTDAAGKVAFESGRPQEDGSIAGNAADEDPTAYEPHYDEITAADQVQIYEPIMGDTDGQVTYTLLRGATYLKDNRLLPAGADKGALPAEIAVAGEAVNDANFMGGGDLITYRIDVGSSSGPFTVSAEILYQPLSYRFLEDLTAEGAEGRALRSLLTAADDLPQRAGAGVTVTVK